VRVLPVAAGVAVAAAVALTGLALALDLTSDLSSGHYDDARRTEFCAYVLVFLGIALAAVGREVSGLSRRSRLTVAATAAGTGATALGTCIGAVVWAYRVSGFELLHAYALASFSRMLAFATLAFAVLGAVSPWRRGVAVAALLGLVAVVTTAVALIRSSDEPLFSLATTAVVLAAAAAFSARRPGAGEELGRR
jgi:hypothetical protein